ncbi:hypothetical protein PoB_006831200 [Plakobranchus ocellatus]|uniref:Uncharacterized protein n=1 Tax=Plakobranchus ocellatus TaxID=259542 RepID=A0AAV4DC31_9GAST|nr:hypothetical protein PoB_006831200 [Plakobranchus ocellatus]
MQDTTARITSKERVKMMSVSGDVDERGGTEAGPAVHRGFNICSYSALPGSLVFTGRLIVKSSEISKKRKGLNNRETMTGGFLLPSVERSQLKVPWETILTNKPSFQTHNS